MSKLWYTQPAKEWEEALPLGNGRLGAMVYGGVREEHIQVNEESMWYGGKVNRINPDAKTHLNEIRQLLFEGEIEKAEQLMFLTMSGCPNSMHPYQTLGDIYIRFSGISETTSYERCLEIDSAVCKTLFHTKDAVFKREYFISNPQNCMVMHYSSNSNENISFTARLERSKFFDGVKQFGPNGICLYGNLGRGGYEFAMALKAVSKGGTVKVIGENLIIEDADEVTLYFTAETSYHCSEEEKEISFQNRCTSFVELEQQELQLQRTLQTLLQNKLNHTLSTCMETQYVNLLEKHIKDYRKYYARVELELTSDHSYEQLPTDERLLSSTVANDIGLSKLFFDYGRYLFISCSREDGLPATLQGLWNKDFTPPWDSKYTININTEMNYWLAENCNLSECHLPLFNLLKKMVPNGQRTAKEMYGCRGFVCHHNTDIHGDTVVQDLWIPGSYWVMGAAWLCTHLWTHYQYTLDKPFLMESFPIMREAATFFLDFLVEYNGYLVTCPSVSPENTYILPNGNKGANSFGVTMDNQILRDLFTQCIKAAQILAIEDELNEQLKEALAMLIPTKISEKGTIMEWHEDYEEFEPGHRHISHLYGLHPSDQITMDGTPELAKAARQTLEQRLSHGGGHTGWSRAWIINHYAKLWDGDTAYYNLVKLLENSTYPNLFDKHPPFQIDGNFGATAAIADMLVQSTEDRIVLLPALPAAWKTGFVKGLRVKGNAEIAISWEDGNLLECHITCFSDIYVKVKYKNREVIVEGEKDEKLYIEASLT